jgi:hypothetical protein
MAGYQWVNAMALRGHGPQKVANFRDPSIITQLADNTAAQLQYRQHVLARIRNPRTKGADQANYYFMPLLSGDEGDATVGKPNTWLYLLESQYAKLEQWAAGNFVDDWNANAPPPCIDQIPIADQPAALTAASYCVGGPFFGMSDLCSTQFDWYEEPIASKREFEAGDMTKRMALPAAISLNARCTGGRPNGPMMC